MDRALASIVLVLVVGCEPKPKCFECGLTDEWARGEQERAEAVQRERDDRARRLHIAVPAGLEQPIFDALESRDRSYLEALVHELDADHRPQSAQVLARAYELVITQSDDDYAVAALRDQAFVLIAASREGEAMRTELASCATTRVAALCDEARELIERRIAGPTPVLGTGSGPGGCFTQTEYDARATRLLADDEVAYAAALARAKLAAITLPIERWRVDRIAGPPEPRVQLRAGKRVLMLGSVGVFACAGGTKSPFELASGDGKIYLVERHYTTHPLDIPLCPPTSCAQVTPQYTCGGAAAAPTAFAAELPDGTNFGGEREIALVQYYLRATLVGTSPCPPMPPPPAPP